MTSDNCKPGSVYIPCTKDMDASCSSICSGNPENSKWEWTLNVSGSIVLNPSGGEDNLPNAGCMWGCEDGYKKIVIDTGLGDVIQYCVGE
jgi:hypothetical protein